MTTYAHVSRSGVISFTERPDEKGLIMVGSGGAGFRDRVEARAREGYNGQLLVPGVPEAASEDDALIGVAFFREWLAGGNAQELASKYNIRGVQERSLRHHSTARRFAGRRA